MPIGLIGVALGWVAIFGAGCDSKTGTAANSGGGVNAPPPRPGEDAMKAQMEKLLQSKKKLPKGIVVPKGK